MSYAKIGLDGLFVPAKIQYGRRIATAITSNPNFPTPKPGEAALAAAVDELEVAFNTAKAARLAAKSKTLVQDEKETSLNFLITQLASYVDNAAAGDATKIESAGFSVRNTARAVGVVTAPTDVQIKPSQFAGSAALRWKGSHGAKSFLIERAEDAAQLQYHVVGTSTKREGHFNSMTSGKKYWFRIAAVSAAGQSAWSEPVFLFAP